MREVKALFRPQRLDQVIAALWEIPGLPGVTVSKVHAYAGTTPSGERSAPTESVETDFTKLETIVPAALVERVVAARIVRVLIIQAQRRNAAATVPL